MGLINKRFFIGLGSGVALTIVLTFLVAYTYVRIMSVSERVETALGPPDFSNCPLSSVYEQTGLWSIRTLEGKDVAFSQFKGTIVFLTFWATWCQDSDTEMSSIQNLYDSLKHDDVAFLLVSDEHEKTIQGFMKRNSFTFPVYIQGKNLPDVFKTRSIPATFILDREGRIAFKHEGIARWDDEACLKFIRGLM